MIYIVFYRHRFLKDKVEAVFRTREQAEAHMKQMRKENESPLATWEIFESEVTE